MTIPISFGREEGRRHFYYWCPNCRSTMHLETAELVEDDSRNVDIGPWDREPKCPMCEAQMEDWDMIAAYDEEFRNKGTWEDTERWRAKQKSQRR